MCSRAHSDRPIKSNRFAIEHRIVNNGADKLGKMLGIAQALGEGHLIGQVHLDLLGQTVQNWRTINTGRDRIDADADGGKVARGGQGQADDATLFCWSS